MPERDSGGWKHRDSAFGGVAIAGAAGANLPAIVCGAAILSEAILVVAIVAALLTPGTPPAPPAIAAVSGPINVSAPTDEIAATSGDADATLLKEGTQPAPVKVVSSEQQPIDLAQAAGDLSPGEAFVPAASDAAQPPAGLIGKTPVAAPVNTPVVTAPIATPPPAASEFPDAQTMRAVPPRPDGTQVGTRPPSATVSGEAAQASDVADPPAEPAPKAANETAEIAQASTPTLDSPAKLSGKSSRVVVAGIDTAAPSAAMQTPSQQVQLGAPGQIREGGKDRAQSVAGCGRAAVRPAGAQRVHP